MLSLLRIEQVQENRAQEGRNPMLPLQFLQKEIQSSDWLDFRFKENTGRRMDRVSHPSFPIPEHQSRIDRQQKRLFYGQILDKQDIRSTEELSVRHCDGREVLD